MYSIVDMYGVDMFVKKTDIRTKKLAMQQLDKKLPDRWVIKTSDLLLVTGTVNMSAVTENRAKRSV